MKVSMSPTAQGRYRCESVKPLNFSQRFCKGPCKTRRSTGQFNRDQEICDRCYLRMPKTA